MIVLSDGNGLQLKMTYKAWIAFTILIVTVLYGYKDFTNRLDHVEERSKSDFTRGDAIVMQAQLEAKIDTAVKDTKKKNMEVYYDLARRVGKVEAKVDALKKPKH